MAVRGRKWERREVMQAIELYCRTPFGRIHNRNPEIIALAGLLDRTANSISLKLSNFAALDPTLDRKGMSGYSKLDQEIWTEFFASPLVFLDRVHNASSDMFQAPSGENDVYAQMGVREGTDTLREVKVRRHQDFFRRTLLASYGGKCAVTGISQTELLIASHIVPWAEDKERRLDPRNGILLNALHDRAFDQHLITFDNDLTMVVAPKMNISKDASDFFEGKKLCMPERFRPAPELLARHRDRFAQKWAA
jgi:predicted restriction endonuclease